MNTTNQTNKILPFLPEDGLDFKKIADQLYRNIWLILGASVVTTIIAFLFTFTFVPLYKTTALIQINAQNHNNSMLGNIGLKGNNSSAIDTQVALLRTRYILEPVIVVNGLNIIATPHYFPVFGQWKARRYQGKNVADPFLGLKNYAWGGEKVKIEQFDIPESLIGESFKLITGKNNTYQITNTQGELLIKGKVGERAVAKNGNLILKLSSLKAHPGTVFTLSIQSPIEMSKGLERSLVITPVVGNDPLQSTGIIQLQLTSTDPEQVVNTLNAIVNYAVSKNSQQKTQETQKALEFLSQRLPELKENLEKAEHAVNQYHVETNTLSMNLTSQLLIKELTTLNQTQEKLKSQQEELLQVYTREHPIVIATQRKLELTQKRIQEIKAQIRTFPFANQKEINLMRDVKIKNVMYMSLLNNKQQLEIMKAGVLPDITALTAAAPANKLPSHKLLTILAGFLMGAFLSSLIILLRNSFTKTIDSSEQLENVFPIPVQAIVPHSRNQKKMERNYQKELKAFGGLSANPLILAKYEPNDISIESLRSLRVSLHIMASNHHVIALMGSLSSIGKSFVSLNLSQVLADTGKKTLLIDADVRKGRLHHAMLQAKIPGLCEYLEGACTEEEVIRSIHDNLFFLPCGTNTQHPIELFQNKRFKTLIEYARQNFDQVIVDTPPIIPVTDSILIAQHCDIKLFVVSAGKDTLTDVKFAIRKAQNHGIEVNGLVLNHRQPLVPYGASYYRYSYGTA